ncbi:MAG: DRTGG domain-containing protein [Dissulfurispiraceae bacterium]|jgi:Ni/Fe-hydrogenase subunit HybB-like protein
MLTVSAIAEKLGLRVAVQGDLSEIVSGCYISDLLSDVMAHSNDHELWITLQTHPNIVAVAVIKGISALILTNGRNPEPATVKKAEAEKVTIMISPHSTFELAGLLYPMIKDSLPPQAGPS